MSALPEPLTRTKPSTRAKKPATGGRDPNSPSEKLRTSDYDKQTGYAPLFFSLGADLARLSSGNACTLLIIHAVYRSFGRHPGGKSAKRMEWTSQTSVQDWADLCRCDVRTIEREITGLEKRQLAEVKREGRGMVSLRLRLREWPSLPDYKPNVVDISTGDEFEEELEDEQKAKEASQIELTKRPQPARAGKSSRSIPVTCDVKAFRFQNDSVVDLSFTAVVQAGELVLSSQVPKQWLKTAAKRIARSNEINDLTSPTRQECRDTFASHSPKPGDRNGTGESKAKQRTSGESAADYCKIHPRAQEICNLFDPLLLKSQARLLSADSKALSEACEAVGACDHDFLVKFVMLRAARPINSPKHVAHIVQEAAANWQQVKNLPPGQQITGKPKKPLPPSLEAKARKYGFR